MAAFAVKRYVFQKLAAKMLLRKTVSSTRLNKVPYNSFNSASIWVFFFPRFQAANPLNAKQYTPKYAQSLESIIN